MFEGKRFRRPGLVAMASFLLLSLAGTVSGFAASGPPDAAGLSGAVAPPCKTAPLTVGFETAYDARLGDYGVRTATVEGLDAASVARCAGMHFKLALSDSHGRPLAQENGAVPASAGAFAVDLAGEHVAASDVATVRVTIAG